MVIVKLMGGLGNQMFQYAADKALLLKHNVELKLDLTFLLERKNRPKDFVFRDFDLGVFTLTPTTATEKEVKELATRSSIRHLEMILNGTLGRKKSHYKQPQFHFDNLVYSKIPPVYLNGYWQSEKFFLPFADIIQQEFRFKLPLSKMEAALQKEILNCNSICINVRRGDFVTNSDLGVTSTGYYLKAQQIIISQVNNPHYFVFSDDMECCIKNLQFNGPVKFVDHSFAGTKFGSYLQLMPSCCHFIIPNSSFGWWAAWLNLSPSKIVIAKKI